MRKKCCLGVHYTDARITAVTVEKEGADIQIGPAVKVAHEGGWEEGDRIALIEELKEKLNYAGGKLCPVMLSVGGRFYQSQEYESEFSDPRQFAQTLRYDIEEEYALDADAMTLCYQRRSETKNQTEIEDSVKTELLVHSAARDKLQEILTLFEQAKMDALVAEPDFVSWQHYLKNQEELPQQQSVLVVACSNDAVYILILDKDHRPVLMRSYPYTKGEEVKITLPGELRRSLGALADEKQPAYLYYHSNGLNENLIQGITKENHLQAVKLREADMTAACAAGVGLSSFKKQEQSDFRSDGMMCRTLVKAKERAWYGLSVSVSVLLLVFILVFHAQSRKYQMIEKKTEQEILHAWQIAFPEEGQRLPRDIRGIPRRVRNELRNIREKFSIVTDTRGVSDSASNTFWLLFEVLNKLGEDFDLRIDNLSIYAKGATFTGSVANMADLQKLREAVDGDDSQIKIASISIEKTGSGSSDDPTNRRTFTMQIEVKQIVAEESRPRR